MLIFMLVMQCSFSFMIGKCTIFMLGHITNVFSANGKFHKAEHWLQVDVRKAFIYASVMIIV